MPSNHVERYGWARSCGFAAQALALGVLGEYPHAVLRQVQNVPT
ncbi:hypothetical protein ACFXGT_02305 [Streptomyces sp. NPDC059352]